MKIIREQDTRGREQPDLTLILLYPQQLSLMVYNKSKSKVARGITYEAHFLNLTRPNLEILDSKIGYMEALRPDGLTSPVPFDFSAALSKVTLTKDDKLFGYVLVQCPDCFDVRMYWVYFKFPEFGYYRAGRWGEFDWDNLTREDAMRFASKLSNSKNTNDIPTVYPGGIPKRLP